MSLHDPNKVLMGATKSNVKEVSCRKGSIEAGVIVRLKSDDTLSIAKADGSALGISLGKDLSNTDFTAIARKGLGIPVKLTTAFNPTPGAQVHISDTTGLAIASGAGATGTNAVYASGRVGGSGVNAGIAEDKTTVGVAYIDFPGGL